jgi:hypothetical protein
MGLGSDTQVLSAGEMALPSADLAELAVDGDPLNPANSAADCGTFNGCLVDDNVPSGPKTPTASANASESPLPGSVALSDARVNPLLQVSGVDGGTSAQTDVPAGMNYYNMRNYALTHALSYNSDFRSFTNDCTNFISQIMRTGGWKHDTGWYRSDGNWWYNSANQTYTWAGAENWSRFAPRRTDALTNVWHMAVTDVLQIDFSRDDHMDHSMMVTGYSGSDLLMSYHTSDHKNESLKSIINRYPNAWYYAYRT